MGLTTAATGGELETTNRHPVMISHDGELCLHSLPDFERVVVVCAHPDDESFGLGAGHLCVR